MPRRSRCHCHDGLTAAQLPALHPGQESFAPVDSARSRWSSAGTTTTRATASAITRMPIHPGLHWDKWLGPAPHVPYNPGRMNNSWWFDYSGGMLTNWAVHHIDIILWAMQVQWPTEVACPGGKFVVDDMADTPDTIEASWQFPNFLMQYSYRGFNNFHTVQSRPQNHGICFHGNRATMVLDRSGYEIWEDRNPGKSVEKVANPRYWRDGKPGNEVDGPWQRLFLDCVKENKRPPIDLEESHRATACCHLANIAYLTGGSFPGRRVRVDPGSRASRGL